MSEREQRGLIIAATCRLNRLNDGTWLDPSQSRKDGAATYRVNLDKKSCTCPDHTEGGHTCKHYYAASIVHQRDVLPDGTVIETNTITITEKKVYEQDWPCYNRAQTSEKRRVRVLLHDLCRRLPARERVRTTPGTKPHQPCDAVFAMAYKVYCGLSARRFGTDLDEAHEMGFLTKPIPGMKVTGLCNARATCNERRRPATLESRKWLTHCNALALGMTKARERKDAELRARKVSVRAVLSLPMVSLRRFLYGVRCGQLFVLAG